jgi:hypothetical protein
MTYPPPLSLLKLVHEVSLGCLLVGPRPTGSEAMLLGAIVASFQLGVELEI